MYKINDKRQIYENDDLITLIHPEDVESAKYILNVLNKYELVPEKIEIMPYYKITTTTNISEETKNDIIILLVSYHYTTYTMLNYNLNEFLKRIKNVNNYFNIKFEDYISGYSLIDKKTGKHIAKFKINHQYQEQIFYEIGI